jgi:hypothetical protein
MAAAEKQHELMLFLIKNTNFNFDLTDRWGFRPLDEVRDLKLRAEYFEELKNRTTALNRRGSIPLESMTHSTI